MFFAFVTSALARFETCCVRMNNKYSHEVKNMAFRNLMLNVKMQVDHFEIIGELQVTTVDSLADLFLKLSKHLILFRC